MTTRTLGTTTLVMLSISAILNLRSLPVMAATGTQAFFFYLMAALFFLLPSALICAELSSHYPEDGGIYYWVKRAFGLPAGFVAIWLEWINNIIALPATISVIIASCALVFFPLLSHHTLLFFGLMVGIIWSATFFNLLGIGTSSKLNILGAILGVIVPGLLIIALGFGYWAWQGFTPHSWLYQSWLPPLHLGSLATIVATFGAFSGMQITAFHAKNVVQPQKTFPKAILIATILILSLALLSTFCLLLVVPPEKLNVMTGVIQSFWTFFETVHSPFLSDIFVLLIAFGMLASLSAWLLGPARGFRKALQDINRQTQLAYNNRFQSPTTLLVAQALIATGLASIFVLMPRIENAFWILVALTSQFTVAMYIMVFAAAIKLRYTRQQVLKDVFQVPGKDKIFYAICLLAIGACIVAFVLGMNPPESMHWLHPMLYRGLMLLTDSLIISIPLYFIWKRREGLC